MYLLKHEADDGCDGTTVTIIGAAEKEETLLELVAKIKNNRDVKMRTEKERIEAYKTVIYPLDSDQKRKDWQRTVSNLLEELEELYPTHDCEIGCFGEEFIIERLKEF